MTACYLEPNIKNRAELPDGCALQAFVKTSGDTLGIIYFMEDGGIAMWRFGSCLGTVDTIADAYKTFEQAEASEMSERASKGYCGLAGGAQ